MIKSLIERLGRLWCVLNHKGAINYNLFRGTYTCPMCHRHYEVKYPRISADLVRAE